MGVLMKSTVSLLIRIDQNMGKVATQWLHSGYTGFPCSRSDRSNSMARPKKDTPLDLTQRINLTAGAIERLTCPPEKLQVFLRDSKAPGLRVRATPASAKNPMVLMSTPETVNQACRLPVDRASGSPLAKPSSSITAMRRLAKASRRRGRGGSAGMVRAGAV